MQIIKYLFSVCSFVLLIECFFLGFILREVFDELLETEKNSQAFSMEVGKTTRQAS